MRTQWTILFFFLQALLVGLLFGRETHAIVLKRRKAKRLGLAQPPPPTAWTAVKMFTTISLVRPVKMLLTEPIVTFICLYVACEFATLFCFFASVPYVFQGVCHFDVESTGLVYSSNIAGCLLGFVTIVLCDILFYRPQAPKHPTHQVPPEWRLVPGLIGSLGIPLGIF